VADGTDRGGAKASKPAPDDAVIVLPEEKKAA
jgi:hypothetical protein